MKKPQSFIVNIDDFVLKDAAVPEDVAPPLFEEEKQRSEMRLRERFANTLLILFSFSFLATFALIFLYGFKVITISEGLLYSLIGASVAEIIGIILIPTKYLFR